MAKNKITILNLAGPLCPELSTYFEQKEIKVLDPDLNTHPELLTHILTKDQDDFSELANRFQTVKNSISLISLSPVIDLQNFALSNGKLILDESWLKNNFGHFILDKHFQGYGGISLSDNYPSFQEEGAFNITNPFNTGEYLDRMVYSALENGMSGLSIKTFFDHLIMYLAGLKNERKLGFPIEVVYGVFEETFGIQLHFFTQNFMLKDVTSSLSTNVSGEAEAYLLNIAIQTCDFFDFTILHDVNKTVITALWNKNEKIKTNNHGLLFSDLPASAGITQFPMRGVTSYQISPSELLDLSEKVILPSNQDVEEVVSQILKGHSVNLETSDSINDSLDEDEDPIQVAKSRSYSFEDVVSLVKGLNERGDLAQIVAGENKDSEDDIKNVIGQSRVTDSSHFLQEQMKRADEISQLKSLDDLMSSALMSRFQDFLSELGTNEEDASEEDFAVFQRSELAKIKKQVHEHLNLRLDSNLFPLDDESDHTDSGEFDTNQLQSLIAENQLLRNSQLIKDQLSKLAEIAQVTSLKDQIPPALISKFKDFVSELGKDEQDATEDDLAKFKKAEQLKIIRQVTEKINSNEPLSVLTLKDSKLIKDQLGKFAEVAQITSLKDQLPPALVSKFKNYLSERGKNQEEATEEDLVAFKKVEQLRIVRQVTQHIDTNIPLNDLPSNHLNKNEIGQKNNDQITHLLHSENKFLETSKIIKDQLAKVAEIAEVKTLKEKLSPELQAQFEKFLTSIGKKMEDASEDDLASFKKVELKKVVGHVTDKLNSDLALTFNSFNKDQESGNKPEIDNEKIRALQSDNENLKNKLKVLFSEVKILKESRDQMASLKQKAIDSAELSKQVPISLQDEDRLRTQFISKLNLNEKISDDDLLKLTKVLEFDEKNLQQAKEQELALKKLNIEADQRESFFAKEIEKFQRLQKSKDLIIAKVKENLVEVSEKKDLEIQAMNDRINRMVVADSGKNNMAQVSYIKDLEKKVSSLEKTVDQHKKQLPVDPAPLKDEIRKLQILHKQAKDLAESNHREFVRGQERSKKDAQLINNLRNEKMKVELELKKSIQDSKKVDNQASNLHANEQEIKKLNELCTFFEDQAKNSLSRQKELELKLQDATRSQKKETATEDSNGKVKITQLENNVRKLNQDLIESRNILTEMKKESNKLRQDKVALQNQLDKIKKESDKGKGAPPKKTGSGGKVA